MHRASRSKHGFAGCAQALSAQGRDYFKDGYQAAARTDEKTCSGMQAEILTQITDVTGRVQGVGFRYQTEHVARSFDVTGYVRNLADGRVELMAEGDRDEVCRFLAAVDVLNNGAGRGAGSRVQ